MRQQPYNQQVIIRYLLGTLSQAETERFDELSFTDDLFNETLHSTENDLIDAYVNGDLTGQLLGQFESQYLRSSLKREKVELARALVEQGHRLVPQTAQNQFETLRDQRVVSGWRWHAALAAAASIILVVLAWLVFRNSQWFRGRDDQVARDEQALKQSPTVEQRNQSTTPPPPAPPSKDESVNASQPSPEKVGTPNKSRLATVVLSPQMRGATETPLVSIPASTEYVGLRLELEPNDYSIYKVLLLNAASGPVLWRSARVSGRMRDDGKVIELRLPARLFKSRSYVLRVSGLSESGVEETISDYPLRIVK